MKWYCCLPRPRPRARPAGRGRGDFRFSDEKAELVKILNNGNGRGFPVLGGGSVSGREFSPRAYTVFGPKLIATRGYFQDRALESRCLTEENGGRKLRDDIPINLTAQYKHEALELRNKLLMFRFRSFGKRQIDPALADRSIEPRLAQIFVPLLSVIENAGAREALRQDRKSTRLNSSHANISYAVFCLKKKKIQAGESSTCDGRSIQWRRARTTHAPRSLSTTHQRARRATRHTLRR